MFGGLAASSLGGPECSCEGVWALVAGPEDVKCWPFGGKVKYQAGRGGATTKSRGLRVRRWMWRLTECREERLVCLANNVGG